VCFAVWALRRSKRSALKNRFGEAIHVAMDRFSDIEAERHRDDPLQPQATPSQSSSSERSETLSSEEKSLDN